MKEEMKEKKNHSTPRREIGCLVHKRVETEGTKEIVHYIYYIGTLWTVNDVTVKGAFERLSQVFTASVGL